MEKKPLTANDLVIGGKYVPHSKSVFGDFQDSMHWIEAIKQKQNYLYYVGFNEGYHEFSIDGRSASCDFFLPSDVTPYHDPNQTTMNTDYTEQPFNLETALKHPEWVRTRDGREIDFIKEYPEKPNDYKVVVVMKNAEHFSYARNGLYQLGKKSNNDLIIRVPYKEVWVVFYEGSDAYWYKTKEEALENTGSNRLACVPVKIPAIC